MNKVIIIIAFTFFCNSSVAQKKSEVAKKAILELMESQVRSWNEGDIKGYMEGYWNSDSLLFIGSVGPQYGWETTLQRYLKSYPNKAAMGTLYFQLIDFRYLAPKNAHISGKWLLKREEGNLSGYYSLLWEEIENQWKIIYDHSSASKKE